MAYKFGPYWFIALTLLVQLSVAKSILERSGDACVSVVTFHDQFRQRAPVQEGCSLAVINPSNSALEFASLHARHCGKRKVADLHLQCRTLSSLLPQKVFTKGDATYSESLSSYYSTQESDLHPSCILRPETVFDVSIALKALTGSKKHKCRFAVRSGGHAPSAGSANIAHGVTFDLRALNEVTLSKDNSTTSVGCGAKWGKVYKKLDALNLTVSGARSDLVGVGGLTTGGLCFVYSLVGDTEI